MLHDPTLVLVQVSFTLLTTALMVVAALSTGRRDELMWIAGGNVLGTMGLVLGAQTHLHDAIHAVLNYALICSGLAMVWRGLRIFCGRDLHIGVIGGVAAVAAATAAFFTFVQPNLQVRLVFGGAVAAALNLMCVFTLLRHAPSATRAVMWVSVVGFAAFVVLLVVRTTVLVMGDAQPQTQAMVSSVTYFATPLVQVTVAFGLILLMMRQYAEELRRASLTDPLTGALNRAGLEQQARRLIRRAKRNNNRTDRGLAVLMVDADHFKQINDKHGHPVGDEVLRVLVQRTRDALRPGDLLCRYGGEEFVVLMPSVSRRSAHKAAERLRLSIQNQPVQAGAVRLSVTVSVGLCTAPPAPHDLASMIGLADAAVYSAKAQGRNRVVGSELASSATAQAGFAAEVV
jgi:diguanylate cyclase (GGDEF)-like protein